MRGLLFTALMTAAPAAAGSFDYDFDGVLVDHFVSLPAQFEIDPLPQDPVGERLTYDSTGATALEEKALGLQAVFAPRYTQSWSASIEVVVPALYDSPQTDNPMLFDAIGAGLGAFHNFGQPGGATQISMDAVLEVADSQRNLLSSVSAQDVLDDEVFLTPQAVLPTTATSVTLGLAFNSQTKVLSAFADGVAINSVDTDAPGTDWGMTDADTFDIALFGFSENEEVFAGDPLTFDNFRASVVPEPAGVAVLSSMLAAACRRRRVTEA